MMPHPQSGYLFDLAVVNAARTSFLGEFQRRRSGQETTVLLDEASPHHPIRDGRVQVSHLRPAHHILAMGSAPDVVI
jgi:hypothetical protein